MIRETWHCDTPLESLGRMVETLPDEPVARAVVRAYKLGTLEPWGEYMPSSFHPWWRVELVGQEVGLAAIGEQLIAELGLEGAWPLLPESAGDGTFAIQLLPGRPHLSLLLLPSLSWRLERTTPITDRLDWLMG